MAKQPNLLILSGIIRILDGLTDDADRRRAVELAFSEPVASDESVFLASQAIRSWTERAEVPTFVEVCARVHVRQTPCPADTDTDTDTDGETAECQAEGCDCQDKRITVVRRHD